MVLLGKTAGERGADLNSIPGFDAKAATHTLAAAAADEGPTGNNIGVAVRASSGDSVNAQGTLVSNNITFNGNDGVGFPGAGISLLVQSGASTTAQVTAQFNRIVGNPVGLNNTTSNMADATNNWWGSNAGPGGSGSDTVSGPVDFNPWLVLQVTASPNSLQPGGVATVVADLTKNSSGVDTSALGHVPDDIRVFFGSPIVFGTINPIISATAFGKALATYVAGATPGLTYADAQVDGVSISANVSIEPSATTIRLTTLHIVPNLLNVTAQVTVTAQVSNPAGTVNEGVVTFSLAGVSGQGTVQNGTADAQVVIPLQALAGTLALQLTISATYADNGTPPLIGPASADTPVIVNVWDALLPSVVTLTAGGEENAISFPLAALEFFYVNQVWTAAHFGPQTFQVQYLALNGIMLVTLNGQPQQVLFFGPQGQFLGALTLAASDVVPVLMANTAGPQFLASALQALSGSGGPTLLISNALGQVTGTVPL